MQKKIKNKINSSLTIYYCTVCVSVSVCGMLSHSGKLCLTLCNPMVYSAPGSSVHGIPQARILEWITIHFSRGSSQPRDQSHVSCIGRQILYP